MSGTLTRTRLARAQRDLRAQFKARNTQFEGLVILFPETEVKSEVTPVKYKTGKIKRVARV